MPEKVKLPTQKPIDLKTGSNQALTKDPISISDGGKYQFLSYFFLNIVSAFDDCRKHFELLICIEIVL